MTFKSDESRKAAFANMSGSSKKYYNYNESSVDNIDLDVNSDKYRKWLMKNTMDEYVQLDPRYPNLKGIKPSEIEGFINEGRDIKFNVEGSVNDITINEYNDYINKYDNNIKSLNEYSVAYDYVIKNIEDYQKHKNEENYESLYNGMMYSDEKYVSKIFSKLLVDEKLKETALQELDANVETVRNRILTLEDRKQTLKNSVWDSLQVIPEFRKQYLKSVKVYDRDEVYEDCKKLGSELSKILDKILLDDDTDFTYRNNKLKIGRDAEKLSNMDSTIFITSPRGGHELLSIFSYANNLSKDVIPSLIDESMSRFDWYSKGVSIGNIDNGDLIKENKRFNDLKNNYENKIFDITNEVKQYNVFGKTWLGNYSSDIKNVVFIDDIIASGQQLNAAISQVRQTFKNSKKQINFIPIALCGREETIKGLSDRYFGITSIKNANIKVHEPIVLNKMTNLESFKRRFLKLEKLDIDKNEFISVAFPWSIPDGTSDNLLQELYGGRFDRNRTRRKFGDVSK